MESDKQPTLLSQNHAVDNNMDCEGKLGDFCLVCFSKVDRSKIPKQDSLLSNNLHVIFLLKNVLRLPNELLISNFRKCGSPAFWINLCEHCSQLTGEAMERHLQILTLVNQLRSILKLITEKMRDSPVPFETLTFYQGGQKDDVKKSVQEKRFHILRSTRKFVTNYDYNTHVVNPFIEGDKLARELDEKQEDSSTSDDTEEEEGSAVESSEDDSIGMEQEPVRKYVQNEGKFKCQFCELLFSSKRSLRAHEMAKHLAVAPLGRLECDICGRKVNSHLYLSRHREKYHQIDATGNPIKSEPVKTRRLEVNGKFKCRHCDKLFASKRAACFHEKVKHASVPGQFKCDICGKTWNNNFYLKSHMTRHRFDAEGNPIKVNTPKPHLQVEDGKWKCRYCETTFNSKYSVWLHEINKHPPVPGQFKCEICGKAFNSRPQLRNHRRHIHKVNSAGNPFRPRNYKREKGNIKRKDPVSCDLCGKSVSTTDVMKRHLKYFHEKDFDVRCHVCGKGMWSTQSLNLHLLINHKYDPVTKKLIEDGARLWKCTVTGCRKNYWKQSGLESHMKNLHGGDDGGNVDEANMRFACAFCGKRFWYGHRLNAHENLHKLGKEMPFCCDVCGAKFKTAGYLGKHTRRLHSEINK